MLFLSSCAELIKVADVAAGTVIKTVIANAQNNRSTRTNVPIFKGSRTTQDYKGAVANNSKYGWSEGSNLPGMPRVPPFYGLQPCKPYGINATVLPGHRTLPKIPSTRYPANKTSCIRYYRAAARLETRKWVLTRLVRRKRYSHSTKDDIAKVQGLLPLIYRNYPAPGSRYYAETIKALNPKTQYADMP